MGERPLPDDVARAARAYLAALVSPSARADAWHDLLAEVRYWQDDQLVPVLRLAHQVVGQHERVTDEAAAHALADVGLVEVEDLAAVLHTDADTARDLRERVDRAQEPVGRVAPPIDAVPPIDVAPPIDAAPKIDVAPPIDAVPMAVTAIASPTSTASSTASSTPALRIGFDDQDDMGADTSDDDGSGADSDDSDDWGDSDDSDDWGDGPSGGFLTYRRLVGIAVVVWIVVVIAWLLGGS